MEVNQAAPGAREIIVTVNNQAVSMPSNDATGLAIKQAAVAQGVSIQLGFKLFVVRGNKQLPVADDEAIKIHQREQFRAVAADDNS